MSNIKFYSENDMSCGWHIDKIIEKIKNNVIDLDWNVNDLLEFHNILKYLKVQRFSDYVAQEVSIDIKDYEKKIQRKIGEFLKNHKECFIKLHDQLGAGTSDDFFEFLEKYKIYLSIETESFKNFLTEKAKLIYIVIRFKKLTEHFDTIVKDVLLSDPENAEIILSKYLKEQALYLPPSLSEREILNLIDEYLTLPHANINVLRKIITFPPNKMLNISDKIKLKAKRREKEEEEKVFNSGASIERGIKISYPDHQKEPILANMDNRITDIKISRSWIKENLDYPTLWNNFIYLFDFIDDSMRLTLDSKKDNDTSLLSFFTPQAKYLYYNSVSFNSKEMYSDAILHSYLNILNLFNVKIEDMIEWFFLEYIKDEFQIDNFAFKMPSSGTSYLEKCKIILPEIDRIFKQYNMLVEDNEIDHELIQMSSSSFKSKDMKSFNRNKYVYSSSDWYKIASRLLFSSQSGIFYLPNKKEYENFFTLILAEELTRNDFQEYQLRDMQWLFDNSLLCENSKGVLEFIDPKVIRLIQELYYHEVISYWHCPLSAQQMIKELSVQETIYFESSLFSKNEQDYFDYYFNKSKFTNGHDIRNKYLHGTSANDEKEHHYDYYRILKLLVVIIIKINDDLCIKERISDNI